jgi:hypothetical protein
MCLGKEKGKQLYPHSDVYVGDVLRLDPYGYVYGSETGRWVSKDIILKFPDLFRTMPWWENRNIEDMPEYVITNFLGKTTEQYGGLPNGLIFKVEKWVTEQFETVEDIQTLAFLIDYKPDYITRRNWTYGRVNACHLTPATEEEYLEYQKQKT